MILTEKIEIKDLPQIATGNLSRSNEVVLCGYCKGYGFVLDSEYTTTRTSCGKCEGDGRMIKTTEHITLHVDKDKVHFMPYVSFKDIVDPHGHEFRWLRMRLDMTDINLERKYPELAAVNYDNYDRLVEQYRVIDILKKDHT